MDDIQKEKVQKNVVDLSGDWDIFIKSKELGLTKSLQILLYAAIMAHLKPANHGFDSGYGVPKISIDNFKELKAIIFQVVLHKERLNLLRVAGHLVLKDLSAKEYPIDNILTSDIDILEKGETIDVLAEEDGNDCYYRFYPSRKVKNFDFEGDTNIFTLEEIRSCCRKGVLIFTTVKGNIYTYHTSGTARVSKIIIPKRLFELKELKDKSNYGK